MQNLLKNFLAFTVEKLREDRYRGQINDEVRIGWDYEQTHTF